MSFLALSRCFLQVAQFGFELFPFLFRLLGLDVAREFSLFLVELLFNLFQRIELFRAFQAEKFNYPTYFHLSDSRYCGSGLPFS